MTQRSRKAWQLRALITSISVAMAGYLAASLWGGWQEVTRAFLQVGMAGTVLVLALSLLNYGLRFVRWQLYLTQLGHTIAWPVSLRIYLSGFALTTTPGKAGEAFRGVLLKPRGVPYPATLAAFISERLSDLVAVVLLTLFGLTRYPQASAMILMGGLGILVALACISSHRLLSAVHRYAVTRRGKLAGLLAQLADILLRARRCHRPPLLILASLLSLAAWSAEALAFYWILGWLGADVSLAFACFVYALAMLTGALSFLPGGLGSAEAVMISLLVISGMTMPTAVAATVFIRLATLWFAVALGLGCLMRSRHDTAPEETTP